MLSRVANNLYWMSRYIERAESIARLVDVNLQLLLDFRNLDDRELDAHWIPIVKSSGDEELFRRLHPHTCWGDRHRVSHCFRARNPNSIFVLRGAGPRECAHGARPDHRRIVGGNQPALSFPLFTPRRRPLA